MYGFICRKRKALWLLTAFLSAALWSGCGGGGDAGFDELDRFEVAPLVLDGGLEVTPTPETVSHADLRTKAAGELVRMREQHSQVIASRPSPTLPPTVGAEKAAGLYVLTGERPEGNREEVVPDPGRGIEWYRSSPGDWTTRNTRRHNPYARLFYNLEYDTNRPTFENGGIQEIIAQRLADGASELLPELRGSGASLILPIRHNLGWELSSLELPVMKVWSRFSYRGPLDNAAREYRVGAIMTFLVENELDRAGDVLYQYLVPGEFTGVGVLLEDVELLEQG